MRVIVFVQMLMALVFLSAASAGEVRLGQTKVSVNVSGAGSCTMVALHADEKTSISAGRQMMRKLGCKMVVLSHGDGKSRRVTFVVGGKEYNIDPNRIFTPAGIKKDLKPSYSVVAHQVVDVLAYEILRNLSGRIIALHNNSNGALSVTTYKGSKKRDAADVFVNPKQDPDDFFYVTDRGLFTRLKASGFNVVLQSGNVTDDGSLSVRIRSNYVNPEAQHGHGAQQLKMLQALQ